MQTISIAPDVKVPFEHWSSEASGREDILYFSIFRGKEAIGQSLLHDLNAETGESLVAYHLFRPELHGQGFGTLALGLLQSYVLRETELKKLIIITSRDNMASQQLARKCDFQYVGASREDPVNETVFVWNILRNTQRKTHLCKRSQHGKTAST
jgi:RimJ/RimL family protein N-acetyltransferase